MRNALPLLFIVIFTLSCNDNDKDIRRGSIFSENELRLSTLHAINITADMEVFIAGEYNDQVTLIKADRAGRILWKKDNFDWGSIVRGSGWGSVFYHPFIKGVFRSGKNSVVFTEITEGGDVVWSSLLITVLNMNGKVLDQQNMENISVYKVIPTNDDGYLLFGNKILKLSHDLQIIWQGEQPESILPVAIIETTEGYLYTGRLDKTISLTEIDFDGHLKFSKDLDHTDAFDDVGFDLVQANGDYLIIGRTRRSTAPWDMDPFIIRTNTLGDTLWTRTFEGEKDAWFDEIVYSDNNTLICLGKTGFLNDPEKQSFIAELSLNGEIVNELPTQKLETLVYHPEDYFIKVIKTDQERINLSKVGFDDLFNP